MHLNASHLVATGAGSIRRVIRQGSTYYCGMCRASYGSFNAAMGCVVSCWEEYLGLDPVIQRPRSRHKVMYRCRLCARDYASHDLAFQCANDCRERFKVRFALEVEAWGLTEDAVVRPAVRLRKMRPPMQWATPRLVLSKSKKAASGAATETGAAGGAEAKSANDAAPHGEQAKADTGADAHASGQPAAAEAPPAKGKKGAGDPFMRQGAQYICTGCQAKYFTKNEVVKCFESHGSE